MEGVAGFVVRYKITTEKGWTQLTALSSSKKITGLMPGTSYCWQVRTFCSLTPPAVSSVWSPMQSFTTASYKLSDATATSIDVYPNPFKSYATISYSIPEDAIVQIDLYDAAGR